jgi:hypothetical protein
MDALTRVFFEEGYASAEELFRGWALLTALARVDQYRAECERYEGKYGLRLEQFERDLHAVRGTEDFDKEEDLDDWMFAAEAVKWWQAKVEELQVASGS